MNELEEIGLGEENFLESTWGSVDGFQRHKKSVVLKPNHY